MKIAARFLWCCLLSLALAGASAAATWTTNGPYGGIISIVLVDPANPATLYAAGPGGGVLKSVDRGAEWRRMGAGLTDPVCFTLAIDPVNPAILYAAGGNGIFRTGNGAASWAKVSTMVNVSLIVIDPKTPTTLYAAVSQGPLFRSTDSGKTWTSLFNSLPSQSIVSLAIDPTNSSTLYAGAVGQAAGGSSQGGVYRSTNGGKTWTLSTKGLGSGFIDVSQIWLDRAAPKTLFAVNSDLLTKSIDGGTTWKAVATNNAQVIALARDPAKPSVFYGVDYGFIGTIYTSRNSGATWTALPALAKPAFQGNVVTVAVDPTDSARLYAGTVRGVFASATTGKTWTEVNQGLAATSITSLAIDPAAAETLYAGTEGGGVFKTTNGGATWRLIDDDWGDKVISIVVNPADPATVYFASEFGLGVFKSTDAGATWHNVKAQSTILSMAIDAKSPSTLVAAGTGAGIIMTRNAGKTWTAEAKGLTVDGLQPLAIAIDGSSALLVDESLGGFTTPIQNTLSWSPVCAATLTGFVNTTGGLALTPEAAKAALTAMRFSPGAIAQATKACPKSAGDIVATAEAAPAVAPIDFPCTPYSAILNNPKDKATGYAAGDCGVLKLTDDGRQVAAFNTGLPAGMPVNALTITPSGARLYAGAYGGGVYAIAVN